MEGVGGFLLPLEPGRLLPPAVGRLLLPSWDAAPLRGAVVTVGFWPGEAPLGLRLRAPSRHSPPAGSPLSVGLSSGGARPTRLVRGTVTWTSMWMFLGRGRCPVPEGVHHGLVDPTRELKAPRSPSRGTPSGSSHAWVAGPERLASAWASPSCSASFGEGWVKAVCWLVRSVDRAIAPSASARSWAGVRCSPQALALAAIASKVASSNRASMVGSTRRTCDTPSPTGLGRDTHRRETLTRTRSACPAGSTSIRARSMSRPTWDTLRLGAWGRTRS